MQADKQRIYRLHVEGGRKQCAQAMAFLTQGAEAQKKRVGYLYMYKFKFVSHIVHPSRTGEP